KGRGVGAGRGPGATIPRIRRRPEGYEVRPDRPFRTGERRPAPPPAPDGAGAGRARDVRRIMRLFGPYRARLGLVVGLIVISAGLGMVSPFLLRKVLDEAIPQ